MIACLITVGNGHGTSRGHNSRVKIKMTLFSKFSPDMTLPITVDNGEDNKGVCNHMKRNFKVNFKVIVFVLIAVTVFVSRTEIISNVDYKKEMQKMQELIVDKSMKMDRLKVFYAKELEDRDSKMDNL